MASTRLGDVPRIENTESTSWKPLRCSSGHALDDDDDILAPRGCCASKFLDVLENYLLGTGAPLTVFLKGSKIGLKCSKEALITSELGGIVQRTMALDVPLGWGVNASTTFGGTTPLKFRRAKNIQKLVRFTTNFEFERKYLWNG